MRWLSLVLLLTVCATAHAAEQSIFVAPGGNDANPGTLAKPFATLARARDEARKLKAAGAVTVYVRGGIYELTAPLTLGAEDSGTVARPVVYRAYRGEKPVLVGARRVSGFRPWKGSILQCDLKGTPLENITFRQLFCDGQRMEMARYPNADRSDPHFGQWAYVLATDPAPATNRSVSDNIAKSKDHFTATDDVIKPTWTNVQDAQVCIHPAYGWAWNTCGIKSADKATNVISLASPVGYGLMVGDRYFVRNLLEELDAPGEWYLDKRTKVLYFWPPQGSQVGQAARLPGAGEAARATGVYAPVTGTIVALEQAENVTVRGFTIEACDATAVTMKDCERCLIAQSTIRNCGAWAVSVTGGRRCGAVGNDITATGAGGVAINAGNRKTLERGDCFADNNYIHHIAEFQRTYNTGVNLMGVGNRATHNLIHDCYHQAILMGGNDHVVEYNIVHHTNLGSEDTGGLYMSSRDYTQRGSIIRYNVFHHCGGFGKENSWSPVREGKVKFHYPGFTWGIYLDAPEVGMTVFGNVLYDVPVCGLFNHEGRDNTWENNIVVDAPGFQISSGNYPDLDELSYSYIKKLREQGGYDVYRQHYPELGSYTDEAASHHTCAPGRFIRNIIYYTQDPGKYNTERRKGWNGQLVWTFRGSKASFEGFRFDHNCVYGPPDLPLKFSLTRTPEKAGMLTWDEWRQTGQDAHSVIADPMFVNPAKHDYRLKPGSPALKLGFQQIPLGQIGPYKSELRATWPIVEAPGAARLGDFTTERYFELPGYQAKPRVPAEYRVPRRSDIQVDGVLTEWPLDDPKAVMECREEYSGGDTAGLPSLACAAYDDQALTLAIRNPLRQPDKIVLTGGWGSRDGVEIAFQDVGAVTDRDKPGTVTPPTPILNLYGYPDGTVESLTIAGASAAQAERLRQGMTYAARRTDKGWECEWRLPWAAAGISPAPGKRLRFNLGVRKMEDRAWVVWRGTGGYNFDVAKAGILVLGPH
ncbi:right-handed parallel beta-helix repeat-containing protein [bacterium]|nr:right-handed parallel beta-helix repeat-containing protein [bacterium]